MDAAALMQFSATLYFNIATVCLWFAGITLLLAAIAYGISAFLEYQKTELAKIMALRVPPAEPHLADDAAHLIDIPHTVEALTKLVDSLSNAKPMIAWLFAAVVFVGFATFGAADLSHQRTASEQARHPIGHKPKTTKPTPTPPKVDKHGTHKTKPHPATGSGTARGTNTPTGPDTKSQKPGKDDKSQ